MTGAWPVWEGWQEELERGKGVSGSVQEVQPVFVSKETWTNVEQDGVIIRSAFEK